MTKGGGWCLSFFNQTIRKNRKPRLLRRKASDKSIGSEGPSCGSKSCSVFEGMHPTMGHSETPSVREVHWAALWGAQSSSLTKIKSDRLAG